MENFPNSHHRHESDTDNHEVEAFLDRMHQQWKEALTQATQHYNVSIEAFSENEEVSPYLLERATSNALFSAAAHSSVILGVNGPGAVGKGTVITEILTRHPRAKKLINTTTRPARATEENGRDYHFVREEEFRKLEENNLLATSVHRPGRGWYGFQKQHIEELGSDGGVIIVEEAPATLQTLFANTPEAGHALAYLLPPSPVFETLYMRLKGRMEHSGEAPNLEALQSTLGERQLNEFRSAWTNTTSFLVNDDVGRVVEAITLPLTSHLQDKSGN